MVPRLQICLHRIPHMPMFLVAAEPALAPEVAPVAPVALVAPSVPLVLVVPLAALAALAVSRD